MATRRWEDVRAGLSAGTEQEIDLIADAYRLEIARLELEDARQLELYEQEMNT